MHRRLGSLAACALMLLGTWATAGRAAEKTAGELLPASIVAYLEVPQPGRIVDLVADHRLTQQLKETPEYQAVQKTPPYERLQAVLKQVETQVGLPWRKVVGSLTSGGLYVGFDLTTQGVVVLARADGEPVAAKAKETAVEVARQAGAKISEDDRNGIKVSQIGEVGLAACGEWLIVSNKRALVWLAIDNFQGKGDALASDEQFQTVLKARPANAAAFVYADLRLLRLVPGFRQALNKKSDNPPLEVLIGGILGAIPDAPYVTAALDLDASRLKLTTTLPCKPAEAAKRREFYLGGEARGVAPPLLTPDRAILAISTYRDFASMWRHAPDLFDDGINAKFAEAESGLTTLFAGRNFREEILGNVEPGMQIVVARQEFPAGGITPAIKLPAGALVVRMKSPEETARIFKITFQSAIGFLNVTGGMKGIDPLDLNSEKMGEALVVSGEYLPPKDPAKRNEAPLHYNASPTAAFIGDRFILASTRSLALELVRRLQRDSQPTAGVNTQLVLNGQIAQQALADNRGPLIAQNMLQKGHDKPAAEQEIDRVLALARHVQRTSLDLKVEKTSLQLTVEVALAEGR